MSNLTLGLPALWVDAGMPYEMAGKLFGGHAIHADGRWARAISFTCAMCLPRPIPHICAPRRAAPRISHHPTLATSFLANRKTCRAKFAEMFQPGTLETSSMIRYGHTEWGKYYTPGPNHGPGKTKSLVSTFTSWARLGEYIDERLGNLKDYALLSR